MSRSVYFHEYLLIRIYKKDKPLITGALLLLSLNILHGLLQAILPIYFQINFSVLSFVYYGLS